MEIEKSTVSAETFWGTTSAQAQLESAIPLPNGVRSEKVLSCEPTVRVRETLCTKDGVQATGQLLLHLVVETDGDAPLAFDASATFTHELPATGVTPDMTARVSVCVPSCTCRVEEGGLRMQATLLLRADVFQMQHITCVAGISDANGLETQGETVRTVRRTLLGAHSIRLKETVAAPAGRTLLGVNGTADVGRLVNGSDGLLLDGTLTVSALCFDAEGGMAERRTYAIPFSDTMGAEPNDAPIANAEVTQISASYDADGELEIEAVLSIGVYGLIEETAEVLSDAYDRDGSFACETESVLCMHYVGERMQNTTLREPISVPSHIKDVTRVLYTTAVPAVTDTTIGERDTSIDGLLLLSVVCRSDDGQLYGFKTDLPFSLRIETEGTLLLPRVEVRSVETAGSGRTLACTVELRCGGEWYREERVRFTTDLTPGAPRDPHEGILIYFPDETDTVFSIGKRFGIPTSEVRAQNPALTEPPKEGTAVVLLRR